MSPQQKRPNMDVVEYNRTQLLDEATLSELRQCDKPEYVPRTNIFTIMFEAGEDWVNYRTEQSGPSTQSPEERARDLAKEMTVDIQREYDVCLPDDKINQIYGMSHDFARLALGMRLPAPEGRIKKAEHPVRRKRKIYQFAKETT